MVHKILGALLTFYRCYVEVFVFMLAAVEVLFFSSRPYILAINRQRQTVFITMADIVRYAYTSLLPIHSLFFSLLSHAFISVAVYEIFFSLRSIFRLSTSPQNTKCSLLTSAIWVGCFICLWPLILNAVVRRIRSNRLTTFFLLLLLLLVIFIRIGLCLCFASYCEVGSNKDQRHCFDEADNVSIEFVILCWFWIGEHCHWHNSTPTAFIKHIHFRALRFCFFLCYQSDRIEFVF